jgi:hypothetical protein
MKILLIVAIVAVAAVAGVLLLAARKPDEFRVARSAKIDAAPEAILPYLVDFHRWDWSPYEHKDPAMRRSYGGAASGVGATYGWDGNRNIGRGRMEITEASPQKVTIKLDFEAPMKAHNIAEFDLAPNGAGTEVTWTMRGRTPFIGKVMHVFFDMDRMVGDDFAAGLAQLKARAETSQVGVRG